VHSVDDILRYPTHTYREAVVGEMLECDAELHQWLGAPVGSSWYHIGAIRRDQTSQHAVAWTDIYVLPRYADVVKRRDHARTMVYQQIEAAHGVAIDRAEVDIFPERLGVAHAKQLGVAKGAPALVIVRRYFDGQGELFEVTLTRHPEKRFVYRMEFQRNVKD
jgi:GntR family transcriptional regulator